MGPPLRHRINGFNPLAIPGLQAWYAPRLGGLTTTPIGEVSGISDLSGKGRNLTSAAASIVLPVLASDNNQGNHAQFSEDLTQTTLFTVTNATVNDATTVTLGTSGGKIEFDIGILPGNSCTLRFKAKIINAPAPNLTLLSMNATIGNGQAITLTNTLDQYSFDFTTINSVNFAIQFGFRNNSAVNTAQIELTNVHILDAGWDTAYTQTIQAPRIASHGVNFIRFGRDKMKVTNPALKSLDFGLAQPWTVYMLAARRYGAQPGGSVNWFDGTSAINSGALSENGGTRDMRLNAGALAATNTNPATDGNKVVLTAIFNGVNSLLQFNRNTPTTGNPGALNPGGVTLGNRSDGGRQPGFDFYEAIVCSGAHDAQTRDNVQRYLAGVGGLSI